MRKLFEAQFYGKQKLTQDWNCLEVRPTDILIPATSAWGCEGVGIGGTVDTIGGGDANTDLIIAGCIASAASASRQLFGGFDDWYLPTAVEAQAMNAQKTIIPDFDPAVRTYWTSVEFSSSRALYLTGALTSAGLKSSTTYVRPIRKVSGNYQIGDVGPGGGIIFYIRPSVPTHKISIFDVDLVEDDSAVDVIVEAPGYTVNWNASIADVVQGGIIESSAEFTIRNIDGVLDDFMEDLLTNREGKFLVEIQKKTVDTETWEGFWKGVILSDFSERLDIPNEPISFQANDGMFLLDAIDLTAQDSEVMLITIIKGLRQIPSYNLFANLSELRFLWVKTDWFSDALPADEEPLYQIGMFGQSLWRKKVQKEGYSGVVATVIEPMTYKEVIQHICERFNCILVMQQGSWFMYQRDLLTSETITFETYRAYPTGTPDNWRTNPWTYEVDSYKEIDQGERYRAGGGFFNLPGLKSVETIYGGGNLDEGSDSILPSAWEPDQVYTTMPLTTGAGNYLHIKMSFLENFLIDWVGASPPEEYFKARAEYKLVVQCGAYYLNPYTGEWSLDSSVSDSIISSTYLYHTIPINTSTWSFIDQVLVQMDIITDDLPDDGEITFELQRYQIQIFTGGASFTCVIGSHFNFSPDLNSHFLFYIVGDDEPVNYVTFIAENPTDGFQLKHDMGEGMFGTARVIMNRVIGYQNGGGELWNKGYASAKTYYFNELLVKRILDAQDQSLLCFSGSIFERDSDYMHLFQSLEFAVDGTTYRFLFNNVTYNAHEEKWEGDWIEIWETKQVIVPELNDFPLGLDSQPALPRPPGPIFEDIVENLYEIESDNLDVTQGGTTTGGVITNHTTFQAYKEPYPKPAIGRSLLLATGAGILKMINFNGDETTITPIPRRKNVATIGGTQTEAGQLVFETFLAAKTYIQALTGDEALDSENTWEIILQAGTITETITAFDYCTIKGTLSTQIADLQSESVYTSPIDLIKTGVHGCTIIDLKLTAGTCLRLFDCTIEDTDTPTGKVYVNMRDCAILGGDFTDFEFIGNSLNNSFNPLNPISNVTSNGAFLYCDATEDVVFISPLTFGFGTIALNGDITGAIFHSLLNNTADVTLTDNLILFNIETVHEFTITVPNGVILTTNKLSPNITVVVEAGGTWNQLDYLDLSGYVPYSGATTDVDLGANNLTAEKLFTTVKDNSVQIGTTTALGEQSWAVFGGGRSMIGYNGVSRNTVIQGAGSKGIEFNVNNATFGSGTAMVVASNGNVGIGTTAPTSTSKLHVYAGSSGGAASAAANMIIEDAGSNILQMLAPATAVQGIMFGSSVGASDGYLRYDHVAREMSLYSAGVKGLILDSSGNLGINSNTPIAKLDVVGGDIYFDQNQGIYAIDNRAGTPTVRNVISSMYPDVSLGALGSLTIGVNSNRCGAIFFSTQNGTKQMTFSQGKLGLGVVSTEPSEKLHVVGKGKFTESVQVGDNTDVASATNVGAIRYRTDTNYSYCEMVMKVNSTDYAWRVISQEILDYTYVEKTADYTMADEDPEIYVTANDVTITMADVADNIGNVRTITNVGTGTATVTGDVFLGDVDLVEGESITLKSNGKYWIAR